MTESVAQETGSATPPGSLTLAQGHEALFATRTGFGLDQGTEPSNLEVPWATETSGVTVAEAVTVEAEFTAQ
ncbi:MAG: hypothetical protein IT285_12175 [Bdellovibrionales bacterium]|nr:hypothetical protein [Bdellovibrionales bacterium]